MKRQIVFIVGFVALFFGTNVFAETNLGKVAYCDVTKAFDEYTKTKEYDANLSKKHEEYQKERNTRIDKIRESQGKLSILKEDEKNKLQAQIDKDSAELTEFDRTKQTDMRKERDEKIQNILKDIENTINEISQKESYSMVFNDKVLLYAADQFDITQQVLKSLNEKYPAPAQK